MVISSFGGKILNKTVADYPEVAAYQPVINGVAGNLVSVQVSFVASEGINTVDSGEGHRRYGTGIAKHC